MIDLKDKTVFLSGPMSSSETLNVGAFAEAHLACKRAGAMDVYNPAAECLNADQGALSKPHAYWVRKCICELTRTMRPSGAPRYDLLVSLPGWEDSDGARTERMVAEACGISCIELEDVMQGEQAIAVTLDVGTCYDTQEDEERFCCSECGRKSYTVTQYREFDECGTKTDGWIEVCAPHFCPNCGRKVMEGSGAE